MERAAQIRQTGGPDVIAWTDVELTAPGPGEVRMRNLAVGLNFIDTYHRGGLYPMALPSGLGMEAAGIIDAVGDGVTDWRVGDRVASFPGHNANRYPAYAEQVVLPRSSLTRYPDNLTPQQASVHYVPSLVGWLGFVELANLQPGETVLVTAASRCWGPYIVQMGKALGAHVIAATAYAEEPGFFRLIKIRKVIKKWHQLSSIGAIWLCDGDRTNFNIIFG